MSGGAVETGMALHTLQSIDRRLDELSRQFAELKAIVGTQGAKIMAEIDDLIREVEEANTAMGSAATLIAGLSQRIRANLHDPSQLAKLARDLDAKSSALQDAIKASSEGMGTEPVVVPPAQPVDQGAGTLPVGADGKPVELDSSGAPIGGPRPNDPLTGQPVPNKPVAGAEGSTAAGDAAAQPGGAQGVSPGAPDPNAPNPPAGSPVAPMTTTGTGAAIATSSPAQPTDNTGAAQPKAPNT